MILAFRIHTYLNYIELLNVYLLKRATTVLVQMIHIVKSIDEINVYSIHLTQKIPMENKIIVQHFIIKKRNIPVIVLILNHIIIIVIIDVHLNEIMMKIYKIIRLYLFKHLMINKQLHHSYMEIVSLKPIKRIF